MNIVSAFFNCANYYMSDTEKKKNIQHQRLKRLVKYAKEHSKALAELYSNVGDDFSLSDLPITSKQMIMENYDDWVTDPEIKLSQLRSFVADTGNVGKRFLNKYVVVTTSGSTGFPFLYLLGKESINVLSVETLFAREVSHRPVVVLSPKNRFLIPTGMIMENLRRFPFISLFGMKHVDASLPLKEVVDIFEKIRPKTLFATASTISVIADECEKRNLKLNIDEIMCGSELLTSQCRSYLETVLGGTARNIYGCTEGGNLAVECDHRHLHVHNSWTIIEPVDADNNPVPFGQESHKVLLTNLSSFTVPIIRYEVTDKIIMHNEPCPCGNKNLWLEIEGRTASDPLILKSGDENVKLSPMPIYYLLETLDTMRKFQVVLHKDNTFEFRIVFMPGVDQHAVFENVKNIIAEYLTKNGVNDFKFYLSDTAPQIDQRTLKFKSVYQVCD